MRVRDEQAWWDQLMEFDADEDSRRFRDFLLAWVDLADVRLAGAGGGDPRSALLAAFADVEADQGFLAVEWLGQMLLVIIQHWFNGVELWESMSAWERRLVEQATAVKLAELQRLADLAADTADSIVVDV